MSLREHAVDPCAVAAFDRLLERYPQLGVVAGEIAAAFELLARTFEGGQKVLVCGNGGSAADAGHIVGELMKKMVAPRPLPPGEIAALRSLEDGELGDYLAEHLEAAVPAIDLCSQSALLAAIGNDTAGDMGFAQQVEGYGRPGDLLWALSTSGRSRNAVLAAATARAKKLSVLAFTGSDASPLGGLADVAVRVPAQTVQEIQELHLPIYHSICEMVEALLFGGCSHGRGLQSTQPVGSPAGG